MAQQVLHVLEPKAFACDLAWSLPRTGLRALLVALLASSLAAAALAQAGSQPVGEPAAYLDDSGNEQGIITVTEIIDPFTGYTEGFGPPEGSKYGPAAGGWRSFRAHQRVTREHGRRDVPDRAQRVPPPRRQREAVGLSEIAHAKKPKQQDIDRIDLASGNRVNGLLPFQVPKGVAPEALYYQGDGGFYRLVSLSDPAIAPADGGEATCEEMTAWWAALDPSLRCLVGLAPFQEDAAPMDAAASEEMLAEIQAIRSDIHAVEAPATLAEVRPSARGCPAPVRALRGRSGDRGGWRRRGGPRDEWFGVRRRATRDRRRFCGAQRSRLRRLRAKLSRPARRPPSGTEVRDEVQADDAVVALRAGAAIVLVI